MSGYVYALRSETSRLVKIGMIRSTDRPPMMRLRELNSPSAEPVYARLGPWHIIECRAVLDAHAEEKALKRKFRSQNVTSVPGATELFDIDLKDALAALAGIPAERCEGGERLVDFQQDADLRLYLTEMFRASGLEHFVDFQEAWVLTLYPSTSGGRYFTLNIDRHEVAFSVLPRGDLPALHVIVVDALILDYEATMAWFSARGGEVQEPGYASRKEGAIAVSWEGTLAEALSVFDQAGVRRALLAYWQDMLLPLADRGKRSLHAKHHDYNAVSELLGDLRERRRRALGG